MTQTKELRWSLWVEDRTLQDGRFLDPQVELP